MPIKNTDTAPTGDRIPGLAAGAIVYAVKGYRATRKAPRAVTARTLAVEVIGRAGMAALLYALASSHRVGDVPADRMPTWHADAHLPLRVMTETGRDPVVLVSASRQGRVAVVSEGFLDADIETQKSHYNRALAADLTHVGLAAGNVASWAVTNTALRRGFVGDRNRLSGRRATAYAATTYALALAQVKVSRRVRRSVNAAHLAH